MTTYIGKSSACPIDCVFTNCWDTPCGFYASRMTTHTEPTSEAVEAAWDAIQNDLFTGEVVTDEAVEIIDYLRHQYNTLRAALTAAEERARKAEDALLMASRALVQRRFDLDEPSRGVTWSASHEEYAEQVAQHFIEEAAARDAVEEGR